MGKTSLTVVSTPSFTPMKLPFKVKSVQIRNLHFINTLWVANYRNGLLNGDSRYEIPPRSDMVMEIDPELKDFKLFVCHDGRAGIADIIIEYSPFMYYGVRGVVQGDMNATRTWQDYTEYTAVNDNENIAYNVAVQIAAIAPASRTRDVLIKAQTNGALIGLDNQHALARGPPVVATYHLLEGERLILSDVSLFLEITAMNDAALANCELWIMVQGD